MKDKNAFPEKRESQALSVTGLLCGAGGGIVVVLLFSLWGVSV